MPLYSLRKCARAPLDVKRVGMRPFWLGPLRSRSVLTLNHVWQVSTELKENVISDWIIMTYIIEVRTCKNRSK